IPLLAQHFLGRSSAKMGRKVTSFAPEVLDRLVRFGWRGNVRELENVVERAVVLTPGERVELAALPDYLQTKPTPTGEADPGGLLRMPFAQAKALAVAAFEQRYLTQALARTGGNVSAAALAAGMDRSNFRRLLKDYGLSGSREASGSEGVA